MITNVLKCEATGKSRYPTPGDAKNAILIISRRNRTSNRHKKITGKDKIKRYYKCNHCKGFHLTSNDYKPTRTLQKEKLLNAERSKGLIITNEEALQWKKDSLPFPKI
jgi:hypothetical protein